MNIIMKISSREIVKRAVALQYFMDSLKKKWENDPDFMESKSNVSGESIKEIKREAIALISKFYGYKDLKSIHATSEDYASLILNLPNSWKEASQLMESEVKLKSADPTKSKLISLGIKEEDLTNKEVVAWLEDRYIKNKGSEIHPILEGLETIKEYVSSKDPLLAKLKVDDGLKKELEDRGFGEDSLKNPLNLSLDNMIQILNQYKHGGKTTIRTVGVEIRPSERVDKVGEWNIWLPQTQETSAKIAGYDDVTKDPKTTWCTGRTKGSNLFYHYISRGQIISFLFYIIKDNPVEIEDWLSLGLVGDKNRGIDSIRPEFSGRNGGITVSRDNRGLYESDFKRILGDSWEEIFKKIKSKIVELGGENPATAELKRYAKNLSLFKREFWNKSEEEREDFSEIILQLDPSSEVSFFLGKISAEKDPEYALRHYSNDGWANEKREDLGNKTLMEYAGKIHADKAPEYFLMSFSYEDWANEKREDLGNQTFVEYTRKKIAEKNPEYVLRHYSNNGWANEKEEYLNNQTLMEYAGKIFAKQDPMLFLWFFSWEEWSNKKREDLGNQTLVEYAKREDLGNQTLVEYAKEMIELKKVEATLRSNGSRLIKLSKALHLIGLSKDAESIINLK